VGEFRTTRSCCAQSRLRALGKSRRAGCDRLISPRGSVGSVAAALTIPYVKTVRSLSVEETVGQVVLAAQEISRELGGANRPIESAARSSRELTSPLDRRRCADRRAREADLGADRPRRPPGRHRCQRPTPWRIRNWRRLQQPVKTHPCPSHGLSLPAFESVQVKFAYRNIFIAKYYNRA